MLLDLPRKILTLLGLLLKFFCLFLRILFRVLDALDNVFRLSQEFANAGTVKNVVCHSRRSKA